VDSGGELGLTFLSHTNHTLEGIDEENSYKAISRQLYVAGQEFQPDSHEGDFQLKTDCQLFSFPA
jgi:hypothetical protein